MILSAHQPAYLPWLGYFEKIARADVFVYLDTVQFEKNSFINRNRIKTPQGTQWLTIPIKTKGHIGSTLLETQIDDAQTWRKKHLKSIEMNYRKARYFERNFPILQQLILLPEPRLSEICWHQLQFWLREFRINTRIVRASNLPVNSKKSDLVLDLCKHLGASWYLSGALGRDYLDEDAFSDAAVDVEYQDFRHPVYPQLWGDFEPYLSIVDYWMNCGDTLDILYEGERDGV
ncbi:MAG: WbqC family protein [Zetaproteobacteria bacterium]|nr:WbqC family protein [Zetaproteobacteria bacterium]